MFNLFKKKPIRQIEVFEIDKENRAEFLEKFYSTRTPVLIKNGAKDWPLMLNWSIDYIIENSGSYICNIVKDSRPASASEKTTLRNYFKFSSDYSTLTLENIDSKQIAPFLKDIPLPNAIFSQKDIYRYFFYNSNKDQGTLPHNHGDAFNILQSGLKHWIFYDADLNQAPIGFQEMQRTFKKYPIGSYAKDFFTKELNTLNKNVRDLVECIQEPGDIIYIPRQCCHAVLNLEKVMGIVFETKILK